MDTDYYTASVCFIAGNLYHGNWGIVKDSIKTHESLFGDASPMLASFFSISRGTAREDTVFDNWVIVRLEGKDEEIYRGRFPDTWIKADV
jgi:hypothetical protein